MSTTRKEGVSEQRTALPVSPSQIVDPEPPVIIEAGKPQGLKGSMCSSAVHITDEGKVLSDHPVTATPTPLTHADRKEFNDHPVTLDWIFLADQSLTRKGTAEQARK